MISLKSIYRLSIHIVLASLVILPLVTGFVGSVAAAGFPPGAVYTQTNAANGNQVMVYDRAPNGTLTFRGAFATGGLGSGSALGSEGALVLSKNNQWLFAVNAGSNQISVFAVDPGGLALTDVISSGGQSPISLTQSGNYLYVLNAGGSGNIGGFALNAQGKLTPLAGSDQFLSNKGIGAAPGPAQIAFTPNGATLVVTEKATNRIDTYSVEGGVAKGPSEHPSSGSTPFGFGFSRRDTLIVSEAAGGQNGLSAVSSYRVDGTQVEAVSPSIGTTQVAACWIAVTNDGLYAYDTNAGSGTVSSFRVGQDGSLSLLNPTAATIGPNTHPSDMAFDQSGRFLYTLNNNVNTISIFQVQTGGSLIHIGDETVPAGVVGLAGR